MDAYAIKDGFHGHLLRQLEGQYQTVAPVIGGDGVCRLQTVERWPQAACSALPLIPPKKFLLPPSDTLWLEELGHYRQPQPPQPVAALGVAPCDLHAVAYLDRVFSEDTLYKRRRRSLLLIGAECVPGPGCYCPPQAAPPPFDLFLTGDSVWSGSSAGELLLKSLIPFLAKPKSAALPSCLTAGEGDALPEELESLFRTTTAAPLWQETARRCVSCGACSAVCPTCYCYDVSDAVGVDGTAVRRRSWDNCFFRSHALVAGGHNFRPSRAERLRFRFEHKMLGFGPLRGTPSCVGCGRCRRACPVDIDIADVLSQLSATEET